MNEKIDKLDIIKIKNFHSAKYTKNKKTSHRLREYICKKNLIKN